MNPRSSLSLSFLIKHTVLFAMLTPLDSIQTICAIYINDAASPRRLKLSRLAAFLPLLAGLPSRPLRPPAFRLRGEEAAAGAGAEGGTTVDDTPPAGPPGVPYTCSLFGRISQQNPMRSSCSIRLGFMPDGLPSQYNLY